MVLSNSQNFPLVAEPEKTAQPKTKPKPRSYAQVVSAKQSVSLMHQGITAPYQDSDSPLREYQSRIYRAARSANAIMLDITHVKSQYTDLQCMQELKNQYPNVYACNILRDGSTQYLELYIEQDENEILINGVVFSKLKLRVIPCQAVDDKVKMIRVKLSHLPMLPREAVLEGLKKSLSPFGQLKDVGIHTEATTGFFMGAGYAVLAVPLENTDQANSTYQELDHNIQWCEEKTEIFHATWDNMPTWCRYCHKIGHTKFDCEKSKARIVCYSCHQFGHRSFECPRKQTHNPSKKAKRENRITSLEQTTSKPSTDKAPDNSAIQTEQGQTNEDASDTDDSDYIPSDGEQMEESSSEIGDIDQMEVDSLLKDMKSSESPDLASTTKLPREGATMITEDELRTINMLNNQLNIPMEMTTVPDQSSQVSGELYL